jgi:DNA helicase HerA-like ATPase
VEIDLTESDRIFIGGGGVDYATPQEMLLKYANRHGLIAGATGTGKSVTLQILAEEFSRAGTPVFLADVKGDLSGLAKPGSPQHKLHEALIGRAETIGFDDYGYEAAPVVFWDMFGDQGHPIRTTVSEMGPLLLARMLDLSEAQEGVLNIAFRIADEQGMLLLDLKDLQSMLNFVGESREEISLRYGNVSVQSVAAIQRKLLVLENQGGANFFGEPALALNDMIAHTADGRGRINVLAADKLMQSPKLYATFLLWLLSELFEELPEVGDPDKPVFVFFFDEAHLLFDDSPKALIDKVEQVARLIRSKGVGVYFITQSPTDVPDDILGQLGAKVQHALRAYTPRDRKAVKAAAQSFRPNPEFDTEEAITQVGVGEALVSTLQKKGVPTVVERTLIRPPSSQIGPITADERRAVVNKSPIAGLYEAEVDRESAFEILRNKAEEVERAKREEEERRETPTRTRRYEPSVEPRPRATTRRATTRQSTGEAFAKSVARAVGSQLGRQIIRGVLGSLFKGR